MDELEDPEGLEKRQRKRQKKLFNQIRDQMEFYFGDSNLNKDRFLNGLIHSSENGYIDLAVFMKFNRILRLTQNVETVAQALLHSKVLQLSEDHSKVRRITPVETLKDVDERTLYVENFPSHIDHDWLKKFFSAFGIVNYISLPKFKASNTIKGFAFVEFENIADARKALKSLRKDYVECEPENQSDKCITSDSLSKRKRQEESDNETEKKRLKMDNAPNTGEDNEKKTHKHRRRRKKNKEKKFYDLKVLSKKEWLLLKLEYRQLQKINMKSLKNLLLSQSNEENCSMSTQPEEKPSNQSIQFTPRVIVKIVTNNENVSFLDLKKRCRDVTDIAYVDIKEGQKEGYIRCKTPENAQKLLESASVWNDVKIELVTGSDEQDYWEQIWKDRKAKFSNQEQGKRRGKDRLLDRADKMIKKARHIHFDD